MKAEIYLHIEDGDGNALKKMYRDALRMHPDKVNSEEAAFAAFDQFVAGFARQAFAYGREIEKKTKSI